MKLLASKGSRLLITGIVAISALIFLQSSKEFAENKPIIVENSKSVLVYHLKGGVLKNLHLKANPINPFQSSTDSLDHFGQILITDGSIDKSSSTSGWKKTTSLVWDLINSPILKGTNMEMMMKGEFLEERLTVKRWVTFPEGDAIIHVREEFYCYDVSPRAYNFSQYITLNPSLTKDAILYSNLEVKTDDKIRIKKVKDESMMNWVVMYNHEKKILIGYLFPRESYSQVSSGVKGKPYIMLSGATSQTLASKELSAKSYSSFVIPIENEIKEINSLKVINGRVVLEANGSSSIDVGKAPSSQ